LALKVRSEKRRQARLAALAFLNADFQRDSPRPLQSKVHRFNNLGRFNPKARFFLTYITN
jgi:hypothetical protein